MFASPAGSEFPLHITNRADIEENMDRATCLYAPHLYGDSIKLVEASPRPDLRTTVGVKGSISRTRAVLMTPTDMVFSAPCQTTFNHEILVCGLIMEATITRQCGPFAKAHVNRTTSGGVQGTNRYELRDHEERQRQKCWSRVLSRS